MQRSTAEEEERKRAEEERVKTAQAAADEAAKAAAEESARQAAEQQRLADEAAIRAQNLAMQRANIEQAQMGPSPEVLARIQKELAEVHSLHLGRICLKSFSLAQIRVEKILATLKIDDSADLNLLHSFGNSDCAFC